MSNSLFDLPIATIEKALAIRKEIEALQASVNQILGGATATTQPITAIKVDGRKGKRSAATLAKMAASAKARWAKKAGAAPVAVKPAVYGAKKKRKMSPEGRARIAAAQRARWAKQKAA